MRMVPITPSPVLSKLWYSLSLAARESLSLEVLLPPLSLAKGSWASPITLWLVWASRLL